MQLAGRSWCRVAVAAVSLAATTMVSVRAAGAATSITNVTVSIAQPSSAAGAETNYVIGFRATSGIGPNGHATIVLPSSTGVFPLGGSSLYDGATQVGYCQNAAATTVTCSLFGAGVPAGHALAVTLNGVTNPAAGTYHVQASTTSDQTVVTSPSYTVTPASAVTDATVAMSAPSPAVGGLTNYVVTFKTSSTGALAQWADSGSSVTVQFPASTGFGPLSGGELTDATTATQIGQCYRPTSGTTGLCSVWSSATAGDTIAATWDTVINPPTPGKYTVKVSTSSDTSAVTSASYTVATARGVSNVSVSIASPSSAAGALTQYVVKFTTSHTGALGAGAVVYVVLPAGTGTDDLQGGTLSVGGTVIGRCGLASGTVAGCGVNDGQHANGGATLTATLQDVMNPPAGDYTLRVVTSTDVLQVSSPTFTVTPAQPVTKGSVGSSRPASKATGVTYTVKFTTSSTGALASSPFSQISIDMPAGTTSGFTDGAVMARGAKVGYCVQYSNVRIGCLVFDGRPIPNRATVILKLHGLTNPSSPGSYHVTVSTTSDTVPTDIGFTVT